SITCLACLNQPAWTAFPIYKRARSGQADKPHLRVGRLTKQYPTQAHPAASALSFQLQPGTILALLGPNRPGNTTTSSMLAGLVLAADGRVEVLGRDVVKQRMQAVQHLGALLEGARNPYWRLSAWENLLYLGRLRLVPRQVLRQRAEALLKVMGLEAE